MFNPRPWPLFVVVDHSPVVHELTYAFRLQSLAGDWHEFESKALRKEKERKEQEARRATRVEEHAKEKEKRKAAMAASSERETKRLKPEDNGDVVESGDASLTVAEVEMQA